MRSTSERTHPAAAPRMTTLPKALPAMYFPARSQDQPKLRALIDVATRRLRAR